MSGWRLFWVLAAALVTAVTGRAHDPGISTAQGQLLADALEITVGFAPADAEQLLPPEARVSGKWTQAEFVAAQPLLAELAPRMLELKAGGVAVAPRETRVQLAAGDALNFFVVYPRPKPGVVTLRAVKLGELPPGHREFVFIVDERGSTIAKKLLSAKDDGLELTIGEVTGGGSAASSPAGATTEPAGAPTFWGFLKLGVEHIWTGYDHLLFLFALLVVCRSFRSIVRIITFFTLAHSLTLALATLDVVNLPSRFVEPAIAASIIFVGVENLLRRGEEPKGRWALTFAFGLIHGFGFASVLKELGVGRGGQGLAMPLFTFNLGVEVGQVTIAAIVLPLVWQLRKNEAFVRRGVPVLSAIVALAGLYWLVERTVLA
ncbi:MAG: HupE/UreJ family protein [Verrucomicrobia bacterium]|nr:HupE/UreJ family protein [Verrucomicrobiota bacterium]